MKELYTFPAEELFKNEGDYLTIVINSEESSFETNEKKIKFQNLTKEGRKKISEKYDDETADDYLSQLSSIENDRTFWQSIPESIVFFITRDEAYYYRLSISTKENVVFSEQAYILPVVRNFQYISYYHLLCLSHDKFSLFNGRGNQIQEIDLPDDAPDNNDKALGKELTGGELNFGSYGSGGSGVHHGHNEKSAEVEIDQENYFRIVDDYVHENYTRTVDIPLVLFALSENISTFKKLSKNDQLDETAIEESPANLTKEQIQERAEDVIGQIITSRYKDIVETYNETSPEYSLEEQYQDLALASVEGRISNLLVRNQYFVPGVITAEGYFKENSENNFINDLVINVLNTKGQVYILDETDMPAETGIAATTRY